MHAKNLGDVSVTGPARLCIKWVQGPPSAESQTVDGTEAIVSIKRSVVAVRPSENTYSSEQWPTFVVSVFNGTDNSVVFSTEDITASADNSPLKVFSYEYNVG